MQAREPAFCIAGNRPSSPGRRSATVAGPTVCRTGMQFGAVLGYRPLVTSTWPQEGSVLAVDGLDVGLGTILLVVGAGLLGWVAGPSAALIVVAIYTALVVAFGVTALAKGHRGLGVLGLAVRLGLGFVGRWFSF
jgi:hypothetical protein